MIFITYAYVFFLVSIAGGIGALLRLVMSHWQGRLPWGILLANTLGSFAVGFMSNGQQWLIAVVLISGFAGGLSTFSSFAAQTIDFLRRGRIAQGLLNVLLNLALSSTAVLLGLALAPQLLK